MPTTDARRARNAPVPRGDGREKKKFYDPFTLGQVLALDSRKVPKREISRDLSIPLSSVRSIVRRRGQIESDARVRAAGGAPPARPSRRKRSITAEIGARLLALVRAEPSLPLGALRARVCPHVCDATVRRFLHQNGLANRVIPRNWTEMTGGGAGAEGAAEGETETETEGVPGPGMDGTPGGGGDTAALATTTATSTSPTATMTLEPGLPSGPDSAATDGADTLAAPFSATGTSTPQQQQQQQAEEQYQHQEPYRQQQYHQQEQYQPYQNDQQQQYHHQHQGQQYHQHPVRVPFFEAIAGCLGRPMPALGMGAATAGMPGTAVASAATGTTATAAANGTAGTVGIGIGPSVGPRSVSRPGTPAGDHAVGPPFGTEAEAER